MGRTRFEQVLWLPKPPIHPGDAQQRNARDQRERQNRLRAGRAACRRRLSTGGRTVRVPGATRGERQSVRYAARAQPLDWLSDRDDHMSTVRVSIDLSLTRRAPRATRRVLRRVLGAGVRPPPSWTPLWWPPMSPSPPSRTPPLSTPWPASWPGRRGGSVCRWPTAPRCAGSWATATTGTRGGGSGRGENRPHNPACDLDIGGVRASCGSVADCWAPRKPRQGEHSSTGR